MATASFKGQTELLRLSLSSVLAIKTLDLLPAHPETFMIHPLTSVLFNSVGCSSFLNSELMPVTRKSVFVEHQRDLVSEALVGDGCKSSEGQVLPLLLQPVSTMNYKGSLWGPILYTE